MPRQPTRVLYYNSWSTAHGGSSTSLLDIVRTLDRDRFEPLVVCPEPGELPCRLEEIGVPVRLHPLSRWNREEAWKFLREIPWYLRLLRRERVALVHGNTSASRRSLLQATAMSRRPYVQHIRNGAKRPRESAGCWYASRIVVNSHAASAELRADPDFAPRTVVIHNGIDLSAYEARDDRRTELGAGDRPIVGFVGQLVPRKGLTTLLKAFRSVLDRCPDAWLVVVGCAPPDEPGYEASCRTLAGELGIASSVRFVGYRRDVPAWMRTFDVFALPTRAEPFGKVVVEAMAAACPVVASRVGGIPEILTDAGVGTLVPSDEEQPLSSAVSEFLADRTRARRVGEAGRRHAHAHFSLQAMTRRLEDLYDSILNRH